MQRTLNAMLLAEILSNVTLMLQYLDRMITLTPIHGQDDYNAN